MTTTHRRSLVRRAGMTAAATAVAAALTVGGTSMASATSSDGQATSTSTEPTTVVVGAPGADGADGADGVSGASGAPGASAGVGAPEATTADEMQGWLRPMPAQPMPAQPVPAQPSPAPQSGGSLSSGEQAMLDAVNAQRSSVGCGPVAVDAKLTTAARAHASDMVDRGYFDHTSLDGSTPWDRAARAGTTANAENISAGQSSGAAAAEDLWNSPGHRANIANCDLTKVGIGNDAGNGGPSVTDRGTWVQLFAS